jgi:D-alanyl-lipoteichoic acid acyltransferase DltB (MBOAT superfamily)
MAASFLVGLVIVLAIRAGAGPGERVVMALRATARWSFLLFWLASTGGALATLFGSRFQALALRARDFGLAFASAHLVHLGVVAWVYYSSPDPPARSTLIFFSIAAIWTYVLAILSIKRLSARLNPRVWRTVRTLGVEYIGLAFLTDFAKHPFQGGVLDVANYLPFLALAIAGPILRLAAFVKRLSQVRRLAV